MGKLIKFLFLVALVGGLATGGSYAAAYFAQGKIVGVEDPLGQREVKLYYQGYDSLPGKPRVWVFTFHGGKVPGVTSAKIVVSLSGDILLTNPKDLSERIERWDQSRKTVD